MAADNSVSADMDEEARFGLGMSSSWSDTRSFKNCIELRVSAMNDGPSVMYGGCWRRCVQMWEVSVLVVRSGASKMGRESWIATPMRSVLHTYELFEHQES